MPSVLINGLLLTNIASGVHYSIECLICSLDEAKPGIEIHIASPYFQMLIPQSIKRADRIITVSRKVKEDLIRILGTSAHKVETIYHGVEKKLFVTPSKEKIRDVRSIYHLPQHYVLFLGNLEPKKNLIGIIKAFEIVKGRLEQDIKLVIGGKLAWKYQPIVEELCSSEIREDVMLLGHIDPDHLTSLYSAAAIFLFPSFYEGFGMPPSEAMAYQCPVIVSNRVSLPEICGNGAWFVNPMDDKEIADSLFGVLTNKEVREQHILSSKKWVEKYSWSKAASQTFQLYQNVIV